MGKSTIGAMLQTLGVPVHESDHSVHKLLQPGRAGYLGVAAAFPYYSYPQIYGPKNKAGRRPLDRGELGKLVFGDEEKRTMLEDILHPLVQESQAKFIRDQKRLGKKMVALDIPLLFETGAENRVDYTLVVTAPSHIQKSRVMQRENMDEEKFNAILESQMSDGEKCARADFIVHTGLGRAQSMKELKEILLRIEKQEKRRA